MKILLLDTWSVNIGNKFIEKGAKEWIRSALSNPEITEVSGYAYQALVNDRESVLTKLGIEGRKFLFSKEKSREYKKRKIFRKLKNVKTVGDLIDLSDYDLAVLPGCVLYHHVLGKYKSVLERFEKEGIPLVILGGGAGSYSKVDVEYVKRVLGKKNVKGMISRNPRAYRMYEDFFDECEQGIDAAFFISDWYQPPPSEEPFIAVTYDKKPEPSICDEDPGLMRVRLNHNPFKKPFSSTFLNILRKMLNRGTGRYTMRGKNKFVSDSPKDYLFIYGNADATYSDRVHACVASLVYGNEVYFDHETVRSGVFDAMFGESISRKKVTLDSEKLEEKKEQAIEKLKKIVETSC